jgi:hypothetical protein
MLLRPLLAGSFALALCDRHHRGRDSCQRCATAVYRILPFRIHRAGGCTGRRFRGAPFFYGSYLGVAGLALVIVRLPGLLLIGVLVLTQVLNAILLLPLLVFMYLLARDPRVMGRYSVRAGSAALYVVIVGLIASSLAALAILTAG